nr:ribonuclease H-like domain-containing protein [Tanacetum cinerariifolium]
EQSLDDLFNSLKIYEAEVKSSSSASTSTQNIALMSSSNTDSTNEPVSAAVSVSALSVKIPVSALPNVDTLSNDVIYLFFASQSTSPKLDNDDLKQIDDDDLEEMELKWQMVMLTVRAMRFLQRTRRNLRANRPTSMGFDMSKVECYNCHRKGHFTKECRSSKDTRRNDAAEPQKRNSFQAEEEPTNYALMAFTSFSSSNSDNELRDNALVVLTQKIEKAEQERDDLKLKLEKFQTSSKNLSQLLASQTNDKTSLGYNNQVFTRSMFDCDEYFASESDESLPPSPIYDMCQLGDGYHDVPPPYTGTFMSPKPDLVFHNAPNVSDSKDDSEAKIPHNAPSFVQPNEQVRPPRPSVKLVEISISAANPKTAISKPKSQENSRNRKVCFVCTSLTHLIKDCDYHEKKMAQTLARNHAPWGNNKHYANMTLPNPQRHVTPPVVLTKSKHVSITVVRPVNTTTPKPHVTRPRQAKIVVTKPYSPPRWHINHSQSPKASNFPPKVTAAKAPMGNPHHALKDKGVIDNGCSRHMTRNVSYLSDFKELNYGYVAFGGNPKGGKIYGKGKIMTEKLDFNDGYFIKELKFNLFSVSLMCDRKNNVLFTDTECHVLSLEFKLPDENQVSLRVLKENNMYNVDLKYIVPSVDLTFLFAKATLDESQLWHRRLGHINFKIMNKLVKDAVFDEKEPEFEGRKPESEVNVSPSSSTQLKKHDDKTKREAKGKSHVESLTRYRNLSAKFEDFFDNSINEDNDAGTLVPAISPIHGKSSYVDSSQLLDDPNMPELEDITYSDDEDDVGAEADFTNLETTITVSPIPTTRVYKDHPVTQIIGDLFSATQTRSMLRVAQDQGGLSQINNNDYHTCMFVCFLSQEEPKRVHQAFTDPSWIKAIQEELLQFKMQK